MRSAPGWVESERKGPFPRHRHCTNPVPYRTKFLLDTGSCIVFGRQHHDARHYILIIRNFAGIMFKFVSVQHPPSLYCTRLSNMELQVFENNNKARNELFCVC
jgi:hypothetical protein